MAHKDGSDWYFNSPQGETIGPFRSEHLAREWQEACYGRGYTNANHVNSGGRSISVQELQERIASLHQELATATRLIGELRQENARIVDAVKARIQELSELV